MMHLLRRCDTQNFLYFFMTRVLYEGHGFIRSPFAALDYPDATNGSWIYGSRSRLSRTYPCGSLPKVVVVEINYSDPSIERRKPAGITRNALSTAGLRVFGRSTPNPRKRRACSWKKVEFSSSAWLVIVAGKVSWLCPRALGFVEGTK